MDVNLTVGIPVIAILFGVNIVTNFLRLKDIRSSNGTKDAILKDLEKGHEAFATCFKEINGSNIKVEALLESVVQQLRDLNNNWRKG